MANNDLGDRMKKYEAASRAVLPIRMPIIIRLDGKAFHTLTKKCQRPFDETFHSAMIEGTKALLDHIPARLAYTQSDEVSLLLIDYNKFDTQQWFGGVIQKMVSVSASVMAVHFSKHFGKSAYFDSRVFAVPERDAKNYFVWRQKDAKTNGIQMIGQSIFSHKQLHLKSIQDIIGMLPDDYETRYPTWGLTGCFLTRDEEQKCVDLSKEKNFLDPFFGIEQE